MGDKTHISWSDSTWNPVSGCTRISDGCSRCYIERTPPFRMAGRRFDREGVGGTTGVMLHPERLGQPLKWRKPRRIFVCSLADLFHDDVPTQYIARVWATMATCEDHVFQVLTKRPARMRALLLSGAFREKVFTSTGLGMPDVLGDGWPLRNVWAGVSAESQEWADRRVPLLLDTPAAVRWVSAEPLLGPLDLTRFLEDDDAKYDVPALRWVVTGGESGPNARPMHPDWVRSLRDQCDAAGVAFHFKQWGEWAPFPPAEWRPGDVAIDVDGSAHTLTSDGLECLSAEVRRRSYLMRRVGKKAAGRELDGRVWDQYPGVPRG